MVGRSVWLSSCAVAGMLAAAPSTPLALRACHIDGLAEQIRCGSLEVRENRDAGSGRIIPIQIAVVPALVRDPQPDPLVLLAGGPGQGARQYARLVPRFFQRIRRTRDIVLVDLRGTGDSAPLDCPVPTGGVGLLSMTEHPREAARRCLASLDADPRFYTHRNALADLRDVLQRLGYDRVNLWGGSWGTRSALVFAATYPDLVRSVVLDGAVAATLEFPWSYPVDAEAALNRLFDDCRRDVSCHKAFPHAREDFSSWLAALERQPLTAVVPHPRSAAPIDVRINRAAASEVLRAALYAPMEASRILMAVGRARAGDPTPFIALAERSASWSIDTMALGQTMSILCSEDVGRHRVSHTAPKTLFGTTAVDFWHESCAVWPKGPPLDITDRTVLAAPALILSGALDPVTPPSRGEAMRRHFPNSLHVVAPGGGHNVSFTGCIPRLIADFVEQGAWRTLDASCAGNIVRPPFVTSLAGGLP